MKRFISVILSVMMCLSLCACDNSVDPKTVTQVEIYSFPSAEAYTRTYTTAKKINAVTAFFDDITTEKVVDEDPGIMYGMSLTVTLKFADGSEKAITVFGSYIRVHGEEWEEITKYPEDDLESIIERYPTDA